MTPLLFNTTPVTVHDNPLLFMTTLYCLAAGYCPRCRKRAGSSPPLNGEKRA